MPKVRMCIGYCIHCFLSFDDKYICNNYYSPHLNEILTDSSPICDKIDLLDSEYWYEHSKANRKDEDTGQCVDIF